MSMKKIQHAIVGAIAAAGMATSASATIIELEQFGDFYVGRVVKANRSSASSQANYIDNLTTLAVDEGVTSIDGQTYDRFGSSVNPPGPGMFPDAVADGSLKQDNGNEFFALGSRFQYIYGKYGGFALVWYSEDGFGDDMGVSLPAKALDRTGKKKDCRTLQGTIQFQMVA